MKKEKKNMVYYWDLSLKQRLIMFKWIRKHYKLMTLSEFCKQKPFAVVEGKYLTGIAELL